jgi:hypothetical protein
MTCETAVYSLLSGAGAITAIVSTRIYPTVLPVGVPTPAIVYELISSWRDGALDAYATTHLTRARVQINLLSADHAVLLTMRAAVFAAMQFQRGSIGGVTVHSVLPAGEGPDQYDPEMRLFLRPCDFILAYES